MCLKLKMHLGVLYFSYFTIVYHHPICLVLRLIDYPSEVAIYLRIIKDLNNLRRFTLSDFALGNYYKSSIVIIDGEIILAAWRSCSCMG